MKTEERERARERERERETEREGERGDRQGKLDMQSAETDTEALADINRDTDADKEMKR